MDAIRVAELFAGVGGFRLGLEGHDDPERPDLSVEGSGPYTTVWANQWEPDGAEKKQFAWRCYEARFGEGSCVNLDIEKALDQYEAGERAIPDFDMLVGGFPCQDYSVAKPLSLSGGIEGRKGVLWWQIERMLRLKQPRIALFENVDRLIKSPASQRGRDFAIILSCLNRLGYSVEWRIVNAADYGMPQKRRRAYIYCEKTDEGWDLRARTLESGVMATALAVLPETSDELEVQVPESPYEAPRSFGAGCKVSPWQNAGCMQGGVAYTRRVVADYNGPAKVLGDILVDEADVPASYFIDPSKLDSWVYLKGSKSEPRRTREGFEYTYTEGAMAFPDPLDRPARTILTAENGAGASRMKHVVETPYGRLRRLVPDELDQIQMFPRGWTSSGMSDSQRGFCMGNALVVGVVHAIGAEIALRNA